VVTLSGSGARVLFRLDRAAIVIDGASSDGFIRKLLGGRPIRRPISVALGYDSQLGFIHEVHTPSATDAVGAEPPFDSSGRAGPPTLRITLPLGGGGLLGINVHEVVLAAGYRSADAPDTGWAVAAGILVSFSTKIGPVYLRVDQLGLSATADTMTPSDERNLRFVQAGVGVQLLRRVVPGACAHRRLGAAGLLEHAQRRLDESASDAFAPPGAGHDEQFDEPGIGGVEEAGDDRVAQEPDRKVAVVGQQRAADRRREEVAHVVLVDGGDLVVFLGHLAHETDDGGLVSGAGVADGHGHGGLLGRGVFSSCRSASRAPCLLSPASGERCVLRHMPGGGA
jgi:hypothetical protein